MLTKLEKEYPSDAWSYLSKPQYTAPVGIALAVLAVLVLYWIVATWRGQRWALWLHLLFNGPGAVAGLILGGGRGSIVLPLAVTIYCTLRLTGHIGPKKRKGK
jgi:hypothetical protein